MNTKTMKNKTLGIILSLALVLSLAAVVLPASPAMAATTVAVTLPNGGECVKGGGNYQVKWLSQSDNVVTATIAVSTNNGANWTDLTSLGGCGPDAAPTLYQQTVTMPNTNSSQCLIRVTISGIGDPTTSDQSNAVFTLDASAPSVTMGSPLGGECWQGGSTDNVTWLAMDNFTGNLTYHLEYTTNGTSWSDIVAPFPAAQGSRFYTWVGVPAVNSNNCKVRITATDCAANAYTVTSGNFTIDNTNPTPTVIQPNGGETLTAGAIYDIQWNAIDSPTGNLTYQLAYTLTGGAPYTNIGSSFSGAQGNNNYSWTVPGANVTTVKIQVTATDCSGRSTSDASDANFTIQDTTPPTVTVTSPNGGESWRAGSSQTIRWTATDNVPGNLNYYLYYCTSYTDCPTCNIPIAGPINAAQLANTYPWTVPNPVPLATSNQCRVKVEARDTATTPNSATDCSNNNFTIIVGGTVDVTLTSPNGGETWQGGTCKTITWNATSNISTDTLDILLEYYNGGWNTIVDLPNRDQGTGCFAWAVPSNTSITLVRVTATAGTLSNTDTSDAVFTVTAADAGLTTATVTLQNGWNLISLELMPTCCPSNSTSCSTCTYPIESVLADALANVSSVWYWTGGPSGTWQSYAPGAPSSLTTMTDGKAYWIYAAPDSFTYQGRKGPGGGGFPTTPYSYVVGWNMVGFKSTINKNVQDYLGGTCGTTYVVPIYCWDAAAQGWCTPSPGCTNAMTPDTGYWVYFQTAHTVNAGAD